MDILALAALAKANGVSADAIRDAVDDWLDDHAASIDGLSFAAKTALLACFEHVAWTDENGQQHYNALYDALFEGVELTSIDAVFTQGSAVIYDIDSLNSLKQYLVVTAHYSNNTSEVLADNAYTLSGTLTVGTSTITATYGGKTDTFDVTVTSSIIALAGVGSAGANSYMAIKDYSSRGLIMAVVGDHVLPSDTAATEIYYPVKVPTGATGISMSSSALDCSCYEMYWDNTGWYYPSNTISGWLLLSSGQTHNYTFQGASTTHVLLNFRMPNNTSNVTQAAMDAVTFNWIY